jgi:hypothetical protein
VAFRLLTNITLCSSSQSFGTAALETAALEQNRQHAAIDGGSDVPAMRVAAGVCAMGAKPAGLVPASTQEMTRCVETIQNAAFDNAGTPHENRFVLY